MSFGNELKKEICRTRLSSVEEFNARTLGLLLFSRRFSAQGMELQTENKAVARLYCDSIFALIGLDATISVREHRRGRGETVYSATVDDSRDRKKILDFWRCGDGGPDLSALPQRLATEEEQTAFIAGAYLACGSVTDPSKSYHLEFSARDEALALALEQVLAQAFQPPKRFSRRGNAVVYYKDSGAVEDLVTLMGGAKFSLEIMNVKVYKSIRNRVNRTQNCEMANIEKTANAAAAQCEEIEYILAEKGPEFLPEDLRELALLRADNPDMSLRELGESLSQPLTRSGVNHRLKRLSALARELRERAGEKTER
ncbi:MAG: DNA-binding protein WhiA [Oscillospiraceae bacterium]|nr:DNA-binding protein WhiA [Oscillospiraceae bacterium]